MGRYKQLMLKDSTVLTKMMKEEQMPLPKGAVAQLGSRGYKGRQAANL